MAVKTITVTKEAYLKLKGLKREGESFSQLINRIGQEKKPIDYFFGILKDCEEPVDNMQKRFAQERSKASESIRKRHARLGHVGRD